MPLNCPNCKSLCDYNIDINAKGLNCDLAVHFLIVEIVCKKCGERGLFSISPKKIIEIKTEEGI